eukprot:TRINITY_DN22239_c0_g1_i1.p1 TRINITY_DN22239_c0_g1~~TRINITY_DN22239_c0_g1_i1.p1  ORF type:complete len:155 (-),score=28.08 TRINITY_DN22239_c0_g1_i1:17-460(-)
MDVSFFVTLRHDAGPDNAALVTGEIAEGKVLALKGQEKPTPFLLEDIFAAPQLTEEFVSARAVQEDTEMKSTIFLLFGDTVEHGVLQRKQLEAGIIPSFLRQTFAALPPSLPKKWAAKIKAFTLVDLADTSEFVDLLSGTATRCVRL